MTYTSVDALPGDLLELLQHAPSGFALVLRMRWVQDGSVLSRQLLLLACLLHYSSQGIGAQQAGQRVTGIEAAFRWCNLGHRKWRHPGLVGYRGGWRSARLRQWVVQIAGGHAALQTTASSKAALVVGHNAGGQSATMDIGKGSVRWERSY